MATPYSFNELLKQKIEKFNPYHDSRGRFANADGATSFTFRTKDPAKQHMANMAIEREKQRTGGFSAEGEEESPRMKALHDVENRIRNQNFESAAVIDDNGNEVFFKNGQYSQVGFTRLECMQMSNNTLTHNHPRCSMFSPEDLNCMAANNLYEMRATNRDGTTYSIRRADGGYSTDKAIQFVGAYASEYPKSTKFAQRELDRQGFSEMIMRGEITPDQANIEFGRASAQYMADFATKNASNYGLVFTVENTATTTKKSIGEPVMKKEQDQEIVMILDQETNELEDKAFNEWLAKNGISQE